VTDMQDEPLPPEDDPEWRRHWTMSLPDGATVEGLADSLTAEAEAIAAMEAAPVWVRRGDEGPWTEITAEDRRRGL
jgi:hypothetical protein